MKKYKPSDLVITGLGITTAVGQGKTDFTAALMEGEHAFGFLQRPGRQSSPAFLGAEISSLTYPERFSQRLLRKASFGSQVALVTLNEAWEEANLAAVDSERIGLVIGGSNIQQREMNQIHESYKDRVSFIPPTYGMSFMDSDLCGICTEQFRIQGMAYTVGGASASGQVAVIQAIQAVLSGQVDVCIALGAVMDISYWECQALRSLGAMGSDRYAAEPEQACRPFDQNRDGFIYGECCGAVVIERESFAVERNVKPYSAVLGWAMVMDGNRNPNSSYDGEVKVINRALSQAHLSPQEIDYINPHGSGSNIGDEIELSAIIDCKLDHAFINATKSIVGHGLSSAGIVEVVATLLQMKGARLHPTRNLDKPINSSLNWVRNQAVFCDFKNALTLSFGFGGMNTALCLTKY
ncbi:malonyl-ACP decarboxylase [Dendrosporobacter quercicolus]|uniref:Malonyl-ACP decarboxylase n=1 Tax=Dendrosporobacter quercicolus TaxID=146817 RepID=A0A1G9NDS7_9FIRM|nr:beta-ketoacyl synthase N-terminal-like domain-containing protein [Dendrosporobacter quercicolus]SDL84277.1 malonyl-ACP decarboxylase [Dendrosporobacter quercicolus]